MRSELRVSHFRCQIRAWLIAGAVFGLLSPASGAARSASTALAGTELGGARFDIAQWRGKVVVVNFWARWCTPCRAEMPMLSAFARLHRAQGVRLIGISEDRTEDVAKVQKIAASLGYPNAMLAQLSANSFGHPHLLPITYVVGPSGRVAAVLRPTDKPLTAPALWQAVLPLLGKRP
jgi:thiol-disulfide isomerase/thioredoxin